MEDARKLTLLFVAACEDDFVLGRGAYPSKEFAVRVDGSLPGRDTDLDTGVAVIDDEATGALSFRWKFGDMWSVTGQYNATRDDARATLQEDYQWRDLVLKAGSNVGAGADLDRQFFLNDQSTGFRRESAISNCQALQTRHVRRRGLSQRGRI